VTRNDDGMDVIIVATQVGADTGRLAEKTGFTIDQIRPLESRLRTAISNFLRHGVALGLVVHRH